MFMRACKAAFSYPGDTCFGSGISLQVVIVVIFLAEVLLVEMKCLGVVAAVGERRIQFHKVVPPNGSIVAVAIFSALGNIPTMFGPLIAVYVRDS